MRVSTWNWGSAESSPQTNRRHRANPSARIIMPAVRVTGWKDSSIAPARSCGGPFEQPTAGAEAAMKTARVNQESRAKAARHLRVLKMQSLRSGVSPKAIGISFFLENAKPRLRNGGLLPGKRHPVQESPPHGFQPLKEGLCRLLSEPTPSPRLCISAKGATPQRTRPDYHALAEGSIKTGTFYFAGKRNFLLCLDTSC